MQWKSLAPCTPCGSIDGRGRGRASRRHPDQAPLIANVVFFLRKYRGEERSAVAPCSAPHRRRRRRGIADKWSISGISVTRCFLQVENEGRFFSETALTSMCWISVNSTQELFGKYPNHLGSTVARWPPLQEIPLLARKFHTALTLLRKERRKEGGNVAVCSVLWNIFGSLVLNVQIYYVPKSTVE